MKGFKLIGSFFITIIFSYVAASILGYFLLGGSASTLLEIRYLFGPTLMSPAIVHEIILGIFPSSPWWRNIYIILGFLLPAISFLTILISGVRAWIKGSKSSLVIAHISIFIFMISNVFFLYLFGKYSSG
ncbi:MAG: hypothetical protein GY754_21715 [bacterium]|nr:hypothetical protein [bacterium]